MSPLNAPSGFFFFFSFLWMNTLELFGIFSGLFSNGSSFSAYS